MCGEGGKSKMTPKIQKVEVIKNLKVKIGPCINGTIKKVWSTGTGYTCHGRGSAVAYLQPLQSKKRKPNTTPKKQNPTSTRQYPKYPRFKLQLIPSETESETEWAVCEFNRAGRHCCADHGHRGR